MRRGPRTLGDRTLRTFRRQKILTLGEVAELIGSTVHTARRRLKEWGTHTSYNQNGRYYTLPDIPEFDVNGLWHWRGVLFSRYGNLKLTVIELVKCSEAGLDAVEMRELLGLDPRSFLSAFATHPQLRRAKTQGRFVYYSPEPTILAKQRQRRCLVGSRTGLPSEFEAVALLVEKIKHPSLSPDALSRRLKKRKLSIDPQTIQHFFAFHGLAVKKTPHSP